MGIYTNVTALRKDNLSVVYESLPATVHLAGQNYERVAKKDGRVSKFKNRFCSIGSK